MQKVVLGRTGLEVSVVCLGAGGASRLGQRRGASADHSTDLVRAALDLGITIVDTAPVYGTEEIVGRGVKGLRDKVVISTKARANPDGTPNETTELRSAEELKRGVETSLKKLGTDYVDILHLHGVRARQYEHCVKVLIPALEELKREGKIRFLGMTEAFGLDREHEVFDKVLDAGSIDVLMVGYNIANPSNARNTLPKAIAKNIGTMCMYAVRDALLTKDKSRALVAELIASGEIDPKTVDADDPLGFILENGDAPSQIDAAYRFCRHTPGIGVVMTGTGSLDHLKENIGFIQGPPLKPATLERLARIFGNVRSATGDPVELKRTA